MKINIKKIVLLGIAFQVAGSMFAQQATLDINQVRTNVLPMNSLFWDQTQFANYEVPKGSGKHSLYLGTLWFIGKNTANDSLHGFADRYHSNGSDTWTGPLKIDGSASTTMSTVLSFGRVWSLNRVDIDALIQAQGNGALASGTYTPPADLLEWPGNGPAGYVQDLAPFFDNNSDGIYNIYDGDYPIMKGEQMLYWILNDSYGTHAETNLPPMGIEIHISFYACKNDAPVGNEDIVNYTTFLEYEMINRSNNTYDEIYAGFNSDMDLGYAFDDYVGSHVDADAFYITNGDMIDAIGTVPAPDQYGSNWPVQSIQFLEGKENGNGRTMTSFMYYANSSNALGDPEIGQGGQYYGFMTGRFKDGTPLMFGGNGYAGALGVTNIPSDYMFPWNSDPAHQGTGGIDPGFEWSQQNPCDTCPQNAPADYRGIGTTGPFTLAPGASAKVSLGLITTFDSTITTVEGRVEKNREQNKLLKQWYENHSLPCVASVLDIDESDINIEFTVYPNPTSDIVRIVGKMIGAESNYSVIDIHGRTMISGQSTQEEIIELKVSSLSAGIYYIQLSAKNGMTHTLKFIKN